MSTNKFSRREFLKLGSAAAATTILAACGGSQTPAQEPTAASGQQPAAQATSAPAAQAPAGEGANIQWWVGWGNLTAAIDKIKATPEFQQMIGKNTLEFKPSVKSEAFLTALAGGTAPDGESNIGAYPDLWYRGALQPVDDMINASTVIKKDDILPKLWESAIFDGKMIGVPSLESYLWWGMNYNSDAAKKAGLDPTKAPETWEDSMAWHKALTKFDNAGNLKQFGLDPYDAMAGETDFGVQSFGGMNWWDEQNRKMNLNNDAMVQCLTTCGEFIKLVGPDKFAGMRQDQNLATWGASYNAGVQNMIIEGYWHPGETKIQKPEIAQFNMANWAPVPASRKGTKIMATGSHFVALLKDAKHPQEMFKVGEFMVTDTALDIIFKEVGWIFGKNSWLKKVDADAYPGLKFYIDAPNQVTEWMIGRRAPIHAFVQTQYVELREKVYRGDMTACGDRSGSHY
jgi:maltose-binding protein MalE